MQGRDLPTTAAFPVLAARDQGKVFYDISDSTKSNLSLQVALYFNAWFLPLWFLTMLIGLDAKYDRLTDLYKAATLLTFLFTSTLECLRLYLGYLGNLMERIPELASFWLTSALIQLPLQLFLLTGQQIESRPIEMAVGICMLFFLVAEILCGTAALRNAARRHAKRFYIAQVYGINMES